MDDAAAVRAVMDREGIRVPVIAKLERPEALDRLEAVIDAFDLEVELQLFGRHVSECPDHDVWCGVVRGRDDPSSSAGVRTMPCFVKSKNQPRRRLRRRANQSWRPIAFQLSCQAVRS